MQYMLTVLMVLSTGLTFGYPKKLSEWQVFNYDATQQNFSLNPNHLPYQLKTPLFTDHAQKLRTISLPQGSQIEFNQGIFTFPNGTVITKTFSYAAEDIIADSAQFQSGPWGNQHRLLETRILSKKNGVWVGLPYVWDKDGLDASLKVIGAKIDVTLKNSEASFTYQIPNKNQCKGCHVVFEGFEKLVKPIGPKFPGNLDRQLTIAVPGENLEVDKNQLQMFKNRGWLEEIPSNFPAIASWDDPNETLEERARAYLDVNCAHCHTENGPASTSGLFLQTANKDLASLGVCKRPVAAGGGSGGRPYGIFPGSADLSIIPYRMMSTESEIKMPEVGRNLIHKEGVALITHWINSMPKVECN